MAKEDMDQDETIDSMEDMDNEESRTQKEHKMHAHHVHHHANMHHAAQKHSHEKGSSGGNTLWMVLSIVLFIAAAIFMVLWLTKSAGQEVTQVKTLTQEQVATQMKEFIDANLLQQGMTSTIEAVKESNGVYEVIVSVQGQNITSYASKDGEIFFPSGYVVSEVAALAAQAGNQQAAPAQTNVPKSAKPNVEVFVMSHCPYGTQIEKGLLPVVDLLGNKADIQIKFVNYAMHGQKEIDEQLNQYCIQQEYSAQYYKYLQCFLADGDSARCIKELKFNQATLDNCTAATDKEFGISEDYADKSTWRGSFPSFSIYEAENTKYGVQGSPTLVINGVQVSSGRDSQSLKTAICNAFTTAPAECETALSTAGPSAGFGFGTSGTDAAAAGCGV